MVASGDAPFRAPLSFGDSRVYAVDFTGVRYALDSETGSDGGHLWEIH